MLVYVSTTSVSVCLCVCVQSRCKVDVMCVQGRRHDFKNEGDKRYSRAKFAKKNCTPQIWKIGDTTFVHVWGTSK